MSVIFHTGIIRVPVQGQPFEFCCDELGLWRTDANNKGMKNSIRRICNENCKTGYVLESMIVCDLADVRDKLSDTVLTTSDAITIINDL